MPDELEELQAEITRLEQRVREIIEERTVPDGDYEAVFTHITRGVTNSGRDLWRFELRIRSGPHAGKHVYLSMVDSPSVKVGIENMAEKVGAPVRRVPPQWEDEHDPHKFMGFYCIISVRGKYWQGVRHSEVIDVRGDYDR